MGLAGKNSYNKKLNFDGSLKDSAKIASNHSPRQLQKRITIYLAYLFIIYLFRLHFVFADSLQKCNKNL